MIRGINKKVIEIQNCNSAYFERAFLVVKSEKTNIGDDLLNFNAELFVRNLSKNEKHKKKPSRVFVPILSFVLGISVCAVFYFIFLS